MGKLLLVVAIIALVFWLLRSYRKGLDRGQEQRTSIEESMVRCAHCGVHLPRSESISTGGKFFCSAEHRRLYQPEVP
ncbi:MAG: PP0621 family protein [Burkholderiales bacterium]